MFMADYQKIKSNKYLEELLRRDHTLHGAVLFGLDGRMVELQARAVQVLSKPNSWQSAVSITGMPRGAVNEALDRISGAFSKLGIDQPQVDILINLAPPDLDIDGTWLDLPLAIIMLQAAGILPDLPEARESNFILAGEIGLHADIRRIHGALSLAYSAKPGQKLIIPRGNEKECALILAKPGHEGCNIYPVSKLKEVIDYFSGKESLQNALKDGIKFQPAITQAGDFNKIRGQNKA
jgi:magnesium chelatase family protein